MAELVTVEACKPIAINHFLLYPGERREVPRSLAEQLLTQRPGFLRMVTAERTLDAPLPPDLPTGGDVPPIPDDVRLRDVDRPRGGRRRKGDA